MYHCYPLRGFWEERALIAATSYMITDSGSSIRTDISISVACCDT